MTTPLVSVLMTAYNRENYIAEAIESVLASSYENFELIIVDDGSRDGTVEIARSYAARDPRIKVYVNEKNLGDYPNRNKAASYATGKYIKYLDSDDYVYPHGLAVMVASMEKFPEAGFGLMSRGDYESPYPKLLDPRKTYQEHFDGFGHLHRAPGSSIINREVFLSLGGFPVKRHVGDQAFWFKIAKTFPMVKICDDLYWPRTHQDQEARYEASNKTEDFEAIRKEIIENALSDPKCPLYPEEIAAVYRKLSDNERKNKIFKTLSKIKGLFKK